MSSTSFTDLLESSGVDCYEDDEDLRVSGSIFCGYYQERTGSGLPKFKTAQPPPLPISPSSHNFTFSDFLDSPLLLSSSHVIKLPFFLIVSSIYCRNEKKQSFDLWLVFCLVYLQSLISPTTGTFPLQGFNGTTNNHSDHFPWQLQSQPSNASSVCVSFISVLKHLHLLVLMNQTCFVFCYFPGFARNIWCSRSPEEAGDDSS